MDRSILPHIGYFPPPLQAGKNGSINFIFVLTRYSPDYKPMIISPASAPLLLCSPTLTKTKHPRSQLTSWLAALHIQPVERRVPLAMASKVASATNTNIHTPTTRTELQDLLSHISGECICYAPLEHTHT